jgi:hypothetical protein
MNSEPEWNVSEEKTDACILGLRKSEKINSETTTEKTQTEKMLVNNDLDRNKKVGQTKRI